VRLFVTKVSFPLQRERQGAAEPADGADQHCGGQNAAQVEIAVRFVVDHNARVRGSAR